MAWAKLSLDSHGEPKDQDLQFDTLAQAERAPQKFSRFFDPESLAHQVRHYDLQTEWKFSTSCSTLTITLFVLPY